MLSSSRIGRVVCVAALLSLAVVERADAQTTYTWEGGTSGNFNDGAEWAGGTAPTANSGSDTLAFLATTTGGTGASPTFTNNLSSGTFGLITFGTAWGNTTGATISGSAFTLNGVGGVGIRTTGNNLGSRTISSTVTIGANQTWEHGGGFNPSTLTVSRVALGSHTLTLAPTAGSSGSQRTILGQSSFSADVPGGARLVLQNNSWLDVIQIVLDTNIPIDFSGASVLRNQTSTAAVIYSGTMTMAAGSTSTIEHGQSASLTLAGPITGGGGELRFNSTGPFAPLAISGTMSGSFSNIVFSSNGSGFRYGPITLSNPNSSFNGTTLTFGGASLILATDDLADGSTGPLGVSTAPLTIGNLLANGASLTYSVLAAGNRTLNRNLTLSSTAAAAGPWVLVGQSDAGTSTFGGNVAINRSGFLLSSGTTGGGRADFTGSLSGGHGVTVVGNGVVGLASTASSYTGTTTIRSGTLVVAADAPAAANGALGNASSAIRLGDTTIDGGSVKTATTYLPLTLSGSTAPNNERFNGATLVNGDRVLVRSQTATGENGIYTYNSSTGSFTLDESGNGSGVYGTRYLVTSGSYANTRLWINTSNAVTTGFVFDDVLNPTAALLVSAPATIGRAIDVVANGSTGASVIGGSLTSGTATFSGAITLDRSVVLQAATGGTVLFQTGAWTTNDNLITVGSAGNAGAVRIANGIGGAGGLTLANGLLDLTGTNTYAGPTTVNAGSLLVNGQLGNTAVTVNSGGLIGGSGSVLGSVSVLAGGTFSPGNSAGLFTTGSLTLGGTTLMEIDGTARGVLGGYDATDVTTQLTYGGALLIDFGAGITSAFADNTTFNLFDFGSFTGQFASITTASDGSFYGGLTFTGSGDTWIATKDAQTLEFTHSTGNLVIVPEPGALALAGLGLAVAAWAARRRGERPLAS